MKLTDTILISLSIVCIIIGVHQTYKNSIASGYIFFMTMLILMGVFQLRKLNAQKQGKETSNKEKNRRNKHKI